MQVYVELIFNNYIEIITLCTNCRYEAFHRFKKSWNGGPDPNPNFNWPESYRPAAIT